MEKSLDMLNSMFNELTNSNFITFEKVKQKKNIMGLYVIYTHENEILYIGHTNNFHVRFGTDLRNETTHTLIDKLLKEGTHLNRKESSIYFTHHYKYKIRTCETKREAEALEHLAIWIMNPKYNNHYLPL